MSDITQQPLTSPAKQQPATNPFARALADAEREKQYSSTGNDSQNSTSLFSDALARTGGSFADYSSDDQNVFDQDEQRRQLEAQRKREQMRRKLHDQVNPVDNIDVFNAREKQVKDEIDKLRSELKLLVKEVASFQKDVEVTLMTEVVDPGLQGKYYLTFFSQLRSFIMLLRQKIHSARTWATQMSAKSSKKKSKLGPGMIVGGVAHEKTSTIQDMMHHERSSQYSGG